MSKFKRFQTHWISIWLRFNVWTGSKRGGKTLRPPYKYTNLAGRYSNKTTLSLFIQGPIKNSVVSCFLQQFFVLSKCYPLPFLNKSMAYTIHKNPWGNSLVSKLEFSAQERTFVLTPYFKETALLSPVRFRFSFSVISDSQPLSVCLVRHIEF